MIKSCATSTKCPRRCHKFDRRAVSPLTIADWSRFDCLVPSIEVVNAPQEPPFPFQEIGTAKYQIHLLLAIKLHACAVP